jgi:hypothetical protein
MAACFATPLWLFGLTTSKARGHRGTRLYCTPSPPALVVVALHLMVALSIDTCAPLEDLRHVSAGDS